MTERVLGTPGKKRRRRLALVPLLMLVGAIMMLVVSSASGAFGTPTIDELGANDAPGQKDLTSQATDTAGLPNVLGTQWNWDDLKTNGNNTLDACSLLDTDDADVFANYAVCGTTRGSTDNYAGTTTLYSCGNTRVDRCSSQIAVVTPQFGTNCTFELSATDPFPGSGPNAKDRGNEYPNDTRATCTIYLDDFSVNVNTLTLINTCSYPSQQPNSDPSDCVLIPGAASPSFTTAPKLVPQDSATISGVATGGTASGTADGKIVFSLYAPADTTCSGSALFSQAISVTADGTYTTTNSGIPTTGYTISADGIYRWKVVYNGDSSNNPFTVACGVEQVSVDITP